MKYLQTFEQLIPPVKPIGIPSTTDIVKNKPSFDLKKVIRANKKYFGLSIDDVISQEYLDKCAKFLRKKGIKNEDITLLGQMIGLVPLLEEIVDYQTIIDGIINGDKQEINTGILGLASPLSGKIITSAIDWIGIKLLGNKEGNYLNNARKEIVNMSDKQRQIGFQKYGGWGWYDKWVKAGKPPLV